MNQEMAAYLGRDELRFEVQKTGYTITRNGEPALNLSEGEKTAIAFMYFLKSLEDTGFDSKTGVMQSMIQFQASMPILSIAHLAL